MGKPSSRANAAEIRLSMYGDNERLRRVFSWFGYATLAGLGAGLAIVLTHGDWLFAVPIAATMIPVGAAFLLLRANRMEASAVLLAVTLFASLTLLATMGLGIHHISVVGFAAVMIMSSLVTKRRTLVALVAVAIACAAWLVFGELLGFYVPQKLTRSVPGDFFSVAVVIVVTALMARVISSALYTNTARLEDELRERRRAEAEQERLRTQLGQAQKMESVGRLAGGVAHDFNNLLQVILGHADLALQLLPDDHEVRESLLQIQMAAQSSARITSQLLAFARRQEAVPRVLDLNAAVAANLEMVRRLIGEDIRVAWEPGGDLWPVKVDPSQVVQILTNLAANARDAIAGTGMLRLSTGNIVLDSAWCEAHPGSAAGDHVLLRVDDSGPGIGRDELEHLFEPFFSTKGPGKGTGLGLATVYGIVKQNDGFVSVENRPGNGASFLVYLPRSRDPVSPSAGADTSDEPSGTGTILLVEDERAILDLARQSLLRLGYRVFAALTPGDAVELARQHEGMIDLLLTDVVMPGMSGRELYQALLARRPGLRAVFMSGYTADMIAQRGVINSGLHFLQKPFSRRELAAAVRAALETPARADEPPR